MGPRTKAKAVKLALAPISGERKGRNHKTFICKTFIVQLTRKFSYFKKINLMNHAINF